MDTGTTNSTTRKRATLIGLAIFAALLFGGHDVSRNTSMRHFLNERYSAEHVIGESTRYTDVLKGTGTGGQRPVVKQQTPGAGDAEVQGLIQGFDSRPTANPKLNSNCGNLSARK